MNTATVNFITTSLVNLWSKNLLICIELKQSRETCTQAQQISAFKKKDNKSNNNNDMGRCGTTKIR